MSVSSKLLGVIGIVMLVAALPGSVSAGESDGAKEGARPVRVTSMPVRHLPRA